MYFRRHNTNVPRVFYAVRREALRRLFWPGTQAGIVSAWRQKYRRKENRIRQQQLIRQLQSHGYPFDNGTGIWEGASEGSLLVWNIPPEDTLLLGAAFAQDGVIVKGKESDRPYLVLYKKRVKIPARKIIFGDKDENFLQDRTQFRRDPYQRFVLDLDWEQAKPAAISSEVYRIWQEARAREELETSDRNKDENEREPEDEE